MLILSLGKSNNNGADQTFHPCSLISTFAYHSGKTIAKLDTHNFNILTSHCS